MARKARRVLLDSPTPGRAPRVPALSDLDQREQRIVRALLAAQEAAQRRREAAERAA